MKTRIQAHWRPPATLCALTCLAILLTGCWDYREPHTRNLIMGISIDFTDDAPDRTDGRRNLAVSLQTPIAPLLEPEETGSNVDPQFFTITGVGRTLTDAIYNTHTRLSRELFLGHVLVILIAEDVARSTQFADILDEMLRNPAFDKMLTVMVAQGAAARDVLATTPPQETLPSLFINRFISKKDGHDRTRVTHLWDVWRLMNTPGAEISVGGISVGGNELDISGTAVFKDARMVGWLGPFETRGAEFVRGDVSLAVITMSEDADVGDYEVIEKLTSSRWITPHLESDHVRFVIGLQLEGSLRSRPADTRRLNAQRIERLETAAAKVVEREVRAALERLVDLNADILELGALTRRRFPGEWQRMDWNDWFPRSEFDVQVKVNLRRMGSMM